MDTNDKSEIRGMKRTLKYCGVEEVEISELETKHGKWNRQAWDMLYDHYMANGSFYEKHNYDTSTEALLKAFGVEQ